MWNIFFRITVQLLIDTVDRILFISGNENDIHEKSIVAVDGKVSCGSAHKETQDREVKALQTLNVYSADYGICLEQKFIGKKTNEIPEAQEILGLIVLKNTIVTADAMNCQKDTVKVIAQEKGDYVLALKGNQPLFYSKTCLVLYLCCIYCRVYCVFGGNWRMGACRRDVGSDKVSQRVASFRGVEIWIKFQFGKNLL